MRILFMGTPEFAVPALDAVAASGEQLVAVVTQPDKPRGRGYTLAPPPVKVRALELGVPVLQPETIRGDAFAAELSALRPDLIFVVAYGKILPKNVLDFPRYGCVNAHASILPKYRGAAPSQRAIMAGEMLTGVTAMYMDEGLDTGDIILTKKITIEDCDNLASVEKKLAAAGAAALTDVIVGIKERTLIRFPQPSGATYAAKIEDADMRVNWTQPARRLWCLVRALSPSPLAYTLMPDGKRLKLAAAGYNDKDQNAAPGTVVSVDGGRISVATGHGTFYITECQPEGKRRMTAADLINGRRLAVGDVLHS